MLTGLLRPQLIAGLLLAALTSACAAASPSPTAAPTATDTAAPTATDTATSTQTATASLTPTATATDTLTPTNAPTRKARTATPESTGSGATATPGASQPTNTPQAVQPTTPPASSDNFAPTVAQVWNLDQNPFAKSSTDACGGDMPIDFYGYVGVRPDGDNLVWHRQDGNDYTLAKVSLNHYAGSGPSIVPDFNLSISVTFTSATTLVASHTMSSISNPDCKHIYKYNATFKWNS